MRKYLRKISLAIAAAVTVVSTAIPQIFVQAAQADLIVCNSEAVTTPQTADGCFRDKNNIDIKTAEEDGNKYLQVTSLDSSTSVRAMRRLCQRIVIPGDGVLTSGEKPYSMVIKSRLRADNVNADEQWVDMTFAPTIPTVDNTTGWFVSVTNVSTEDKRQKVALMRGFDDMATVVRGADNPIAEGELIDIMAILHVPEGTEESAPVEIDFYIDGKKYTHAESGERFSITRAELMKNLTGDTPRLTYLAYIASNETGVVTDWSIDDSGIYISYDENEHFGALSTGGDVLSDETQLVVPFTNEVYLDGFRDGTSQDSVITINNGEDIYAVPMSDLKINDIQKSLIIDNLSFEEGRIYTISFNGALDIFGQEYSGSDIIMRCRKKLGIIEVNNGSRMNVSDSISVKFSDNIDVEAFYDKVSIGNIFGERRNVPNETMRLKGSDELEIDLTQLNVKNSVIYELYFDEGIVSASGGEWQGARSAVFRTKSGGAAIYKDFLSYPAGTALSNGAISDMTYDGADAVIGEDGAEHYMPLKLSSGQTNKRLQLNIGDLAEKTMSSFKYETKLKFHSSSNTYSARARFQTNESGSPSISPIHFQNGKMSLLKAPSAEGAVNIGNIVYDTWYYIRLDIDIKSEKPLMSASVISEDGSVNFHGVYDASMGNMSVVSNPTSWGKVNSAGFIIASGDLEIDQAYAVISETEQTDILEINAEGEMVSVKSDSPIIAGNGLFFVNRAGDKFPAVTESMKFGSAKIKAEYPLRYDSVYTLDVGECTNIAGEKVNNADKITIKTAKAQPLSVSLSEYTPSEMHAGQITANIVTENSGEECEADFVIMHCDGTPSEPIVRNSERFTHNIPNGTDDIALTIKADSGDGFIKVVAYDKNGMALIEDSYVLGTSNTRTASLSEISGNLGTAYVPVIVNVGGGKFVYQTLTDKDGGYLLRFSGGRNIPTGNVGYTVTDAEGKSESGSVAVYNEYELEDFITKLNSASADTIEPIFTAGKHNIHYNEDIRAMLSDSVFYSALLNGIKKEPLKSDTAEAQINGIMLAAAINNEAIKQFDEDILSLTGISEKYCGYYNNITESGKVTLVKNLRQEQTATGTELNKALCEQILIAYICSNKGIGSDFVYKALTECETDMKLSLSAYKNLSSSQRQNANLLMVKSSGYSDLQSLINYAVTNSEKTASSSGGSGGGGSSSGGYSGTGVTAASPITVTKPLTPEREEEILTSTGIYTVFNDLKSYSWAGNAIEKLYNDGIVNGRGIGVFAPADAVTRAEFTQMIIKALELIQEGLDYDRFADVSENDWYSKSVLSAEKLKIVNGVSEGLFGADENITRQDAAAIAYRAARYTEIILDGEIENISFADQEQISGYAQTAVKILKKMGIINGYDDGSYKPLGTTTRAEAAVIIYNLYSLLN